MKNQVLDMALACAQYGWFVFPCQPGRKAPTTPRGYLDATTDSDRVIEWFNRRPGRNLALVTGAPGPDVLDIDSHGPAGNGFPALERLRAAGLLNGAAAQVRPPSGGLHVYFEGSNQRTAHLPASHVDFLAVGGYVLVPPSRVAGRPYQDLGNLSGRHGVPTGALPPASWNPPATTSAQRPCPLPGNGSAPWPTGSPASPRATGTPACSGPLTAPWKPTRPPTSAPSPPPHARPGSRCGDHPHP